MSVKEMADTLILWANSCVSDEQLGLIDKLIEPYLIDRYGGDSRLAHETSRVLLALQERAKDIPKIHIPELNMN